MPQLSKEEAGAAVFLGREPKRKKCDDIGATPEVARMYEQCVIFKGVTA